MRANLYCVLILLAMAVNAIAHEFSGYIEGEVIYFPGESLYAGQRENTASLAAKAEYYHNLTDDLSFVFTPFARIDAADSQRTHFDIRELNFLRVWDNIECRIGIGKVFWGVTEFVHLVDIINQTDAVESIDGEEKLGQPMVQISAPTQAGTFTFFLLPWFRERKYPGENGRLRTSWVVDTENPIYESGAEEHHLDVAARYSLSVDCVDLGLYRFIGTGREPTLIPNPEDQSITPFYQQISQTGMDLQITTGPWLLKLEAIHRTGQGDSFFSFVSGFEYTMPIDFAGYRPDLGILGEFAYDSRGDDAASFYENDIMFGLRLSLNDMDSSKLLLGVIKDIKNSSALFTLEASRRFGKRWEAILEANILSNVDDEDLLFDMLDDDHIVFKTKYYF